MKKMSVFVEGMTELLFVERLLRETAEASSLQIALFKLSGKRMLRAKVRQPPSGQEYYVQIIDCSADNRVRSAIAEQYDGMIAADFDVVIGLRDVYPDCSYADIPALRRGMETRIRTKPLRVLFVLAIMEIEAWFLAEHTHLQAVHPGLTVTRIKKELGFDPSVENMQLRDHPAEDLDRIYRLEGLEYTKNRKTVQRTVSALDYGEVYLRLPDLFPDLRELVGCLDGFFS